MTWHAIGSYYSAKAQYNKVIKFVFSCYTVAEEVDGVGGRRVDFWILRCPQKVLQVLYYLWVHNIYLIMHLTHKFLSTSILWVLIPPLFFLPTRPKARLWRNWTKCLLFQQRYTWPLANPIQGEEVEYFTLPMGFYGLLLESMESPWRVPVESSESTSSWRLHGDSWNSVSWTPKRLPPSFIQLKTNASHASQTRNLSVTISQCTNQLS